MCWPQQVIQQIRGCLVGVQLGCGGVSLQVMVSSLNGKSGYSEAGMCGGQPPIGTSSSLCGSKQPPQVLFIPTAGLTFILYLAKAGGGHVVFI